MWYSDDARRIEVRDETTEGVWLAICDHCGHREGWGQQPVLDAIPCGSCGKPADVIEIRNRDQRPQRRFPAIRDGGVNVDSSRRRLRETIDDLKDQPINCARGIRTPQQQQKVYGRMFEHNTKVINQTRRGARTYNNVDQERCELVGQIPREAMLEEARATGKSASDIAKDPEHMSHIAKKAGHLRRE